MIVNEEFSSVVSSILLVSANLLMVCLGPVDPLTISQFTFIFLINATTWPNEVYSTAVYKWSLPGNDYEYSIKSRLGTTRLDCFFARENLSSQNYCRLWGKDLLNVTGRLSRRHNYYIHIANLCRCRRAVEHIIILLVLTIVCRCSCRQGLILSLVTSNSELLVGLMRYPVFILGSLSKVDCQNNFA